MVNGTLRCMHINCIGVFHLAVLADFSTGVLSFYPFLLMGLEHVVE